jgi:8-oxo-dGTP pyrophosphatase MutT (NUDIX family)
VLLRQAHGQTEVLMGRRPPRSAFIPDAFVFPGGRTDAGDAKARPAKPLRVDVERDLVDCGGCTAALAQTLALTAIRETFEETGLLLGAPGDPGDAKDWSAFRARGLAADLSGLTFLGRAITPVASPIRFHARFFCGDGSALQGQMRANGELLDLAWYEIGDAMKLPVIDVTHFVLGLIANGAAQGIESRPFFRYRRNKPLSVVKSYSIV